LTQIRHRIILTLFLAGLTATLTYGVTFAQSPAAPGRHREVQLTSQNVSLPFDNQVFTGGDAAKLTNSRCLLCHSKDMIDAQPPLTLETWKNEIDKMRTAYGCPLRGDQTAGVAEFISHPASASTAGGDTMDRP
jgi:hypothetical protein